MNAAVQTREEWLDARRAGIGGSDVAPILGLSRWKTPYEVYLDKRGELPSQEDNEPMLWGRALEPVIRQQYAERTGRVVRLPETILVHPEHAFMLANVDGVTDDRRVLEVKTARTGEGWGEPGTDEIPEAYALQVQHYLAVTGFVVADVAVLIGGSDFRLYEVPADTDLQGMLIDAEAAFWRRVLDGVPPDPVTYEDARRRYGHSDAAGQVVADAEAYAAWADLCDARRIAKEVDEREQAAKAVLLRAFGEAGDTLTTDGKTLATWKLTKAPMRFDTAAFKAAHADLYAQFAKPGEPSRRLLVKEV